MTSLYDFMVANGHQGGCDCYDSTYEMPGVCMIPIQPEDLKDACDRVCDWILRNVEFVWCSKNEPELNTQGDFSGFVKSHIDQFRKFTETHNKERYWVRSDDEESIYAGCVTIANLMVGRYAEEDYMDFERIFMGAKA